MTDLLVFQKTHAAIENDFGHDDPIVPILRESLAIQAALPLANLLTDQFCWLHNLR